MQNLNLNNQEGINKLDNHILTKILNEDNLNLRGGHFQTELFNGTFHKRSGVRNTYLESQNK